MAVAPHPSPLFPAAARAGLTFGLVLALIYTARFLSFSVPLLQVIYFVGVLAVPSTLEAWGEMLKASPLVNQADAERMITDLRMISTWQWLWTDYMLTIIMGAAWGLIVGLALRRN